MNNREKRLAVMVLSWSDRKLFLYGILAGICILSGQAMVLLAAAILYLYLPFIFCLPVLTTGIFFVVLDPPWRIIAQCWEMRA